jgi:hypothetical protein
MNSYFSSSFARRIMDKVGMAKLVTQTGLFYLPSQRAQQELLSALPSGLSPRVRAKEPVLVESWRKGEEDQVHLVNYAAAPQVVEVNFGASVSGRVVTPDNEEREVFEGKNIQIDLDIYKILIVESRVNLK